MFTNLKRYGLGTRDLEMCNCLLEGHQILFVGLGDCDIPFGALAGVLQCREGREIRAVGGGGGGGK